LVTLHTATKQDLSAVTGLSLMTIGNILQQLENDGEVYQGELVPSAGGRPSRRYCYNASFSQVLAVFSSVVDNQDILHLRVADAFNDVMFSHDELMEYTGIAAFEKPVDRILNEFPGIKAMGFGIPGIVSGGRIIACDYPGLNGSDFAGSCHERYGLPLIVDNDVNCVAAAAGSLRETENNSALVCIYFPKKYGFGAGIYIDGRVYHGRNNYAGEAADMPIGINWCDPELYNDETRFTEAVARLLACFCCIVDPQEFILYADFLEQEQIAVIRQKCDGLTRIPVFPDISLSRNYVQDYQNGLLLQIRELLKPEFELKRNA
jgi:hypothetical protein